MSIINISSEETNTILSIDEIKNFLRIDFNDDDNLLKKALNTATKQCELRISRTLVQKTYILSSYDPIKDNKIDLEYDPIKSITKIEVIDKEGNTKELSTSSYRLDKTRNCVYFLNIPTNYYKIDITYIAGYEVVPEDLKQALLFHIAKIYEDKSGYYPIPKASSNIYKNYKKIRL